MDYNKIKDEIIEKIKSSVNGRVYVGEEINKDFFMMKCQFMEMEFLMF